jgi:serine/threonine-protein kinase
MPDLSNDTTLAAATALGQLGLTVSAQTSTQCSNTVTQGNVAATNPAKGSPIKAGTAVVLITSSGYCQVVVPNVEGQTQAAASSALSAQGLVPSFTSASAGCSAGNAGTVVSQSVAPGSSTLFNSTIDLSVCPGGAG